MAVGDAITQIASVAAAGSMTYQPAAGVEVVVTDLITGASKTSIRTAITDGLIDALFCDLIYDGTSLLNVQPSRQVKLFLTNTYYLKFTNDLATDAVVGFSGIQTK
jgi:hypothetical protein